MPDGRTVLFAIGSGSTSEYELAAVSLDTGEPRRLGVTGVKPFYIAPGYVLFARAGAIWAAPFDVATLEFQAEALPVLEGLVDLGYSFGTARFTVASNASVAFWSGSRYRRPPRYPSIVDRNGVTVIEFPDEISARRVRFSPDDRRIAFNPCGRSGLRRWRRYELRALRDSLGSGASGRPCRPVLAIHRGVDVAAQFPKLRFCQSPGRSAARSSGSLCEFG